MSTTSGSESLRSRRSHLRWAHTPHHILIIIYKGDFKKVIEAKSTRFIFQPKSVPGPRRKSGKGRKKQVNVLYCRGPHDILSTKASYISGRGHVCPYTLILKKELGDMGDMEQ